MLNSHHHHHQHHQASHAVDKPSFTNMLSDTTGGSIAKQPFPSCTLHAEAAEHSLIQSACYKGCGLLL